MHQSNLVIILETACRYSHWVESLEDPDAKIWRPRQVYIGETKRSYVPLAVRDESSVKNKIITETDTVGANDIH